MKNKKDYVKMVAEIISANYDETKKRMETVCEKYGLSLKEYYENKLYELTETQILKKVKTLRFRKDKKEKAFLEVMEATSESKKGILEKIKQINQKGIFKIVITQYAKFEFYKKNGEETESFLRLLAKRDAQKEELKDLLMSVDHGEISYKDIENKVEAFYKTVGETLTEKHKKNLTLPYRPDLVEEPSELDRIAADLEISRILLGFTLAEYYTFRLWEKTFEQKREYLTDKERKRVLNTLNSPESQEILKDKAKCYQILKKYFCRDQIVIEKKEDYELLKTFCNKRNVFVKKPFAESFGKGIEPVKVNEDTDFKVLTKTLLEGCGRFVAEELIIPHRKMKALNPDSINTVRLETYFNGEKTEFVSAFMRVGKAGSFVDNGGAGGIGASIDIRTGRVSSDGCDEMGRIYETHPTTGVKFKGHKIPNWKKALKLGREIADKVPGAAYIGWDLTYTNRWKWIVVEGNGTPQYIFNQGTSGRGMRKEFLEKFDVQSENEGADV